MSILHLRVGSGQTERNTILQSSPLYGFEFCSVSSVLSLSPLQHVLRLDSPHHSRSASLLTFISSDRRKGTNFPRKKRIVTSIFIQQSSQQFLSINNNMIALHRDCFRNVCHKTKFVISTNPFRHFSYSSVFSSYLNPFVNNFKPKQSPLSFTRIDLLSIISPTAILHPFYCISFSSLFSTRAPSRSFRRRNNKRLKAGSKPVLDQAKFQKAVSQLPPRFTAEELCNVITLEEDPLVCWELFNWAGQQPRFRHDVSTYHITIKKLGVAKMYEEMDVVVNQVLALRSFGSEPLFNTIIYFFTEARKLTRAVNIFKHMRNSRKFDCRPSIRTYNSLFTAMLGRGRDSYINHMYMETIRCLFRQMVNDGIEPDVFSLNSMIKGYVLSLHVNDALRVFHQMGVVYKCLPNAYTYDCLIYGLCAQDRTNNARELCNEMKRNGFIPSSKSYNSLVNALALAGEVEEAVHYLREMIESRKSADFITYRTILDEICRRGRVEEAMGLLKELQDKDLVDGHTYRKLLHAMEDDFGKLKSQKPDQ